MARGKQAGVGTAWKIAGLVVVAGISGTLVVAALSGPPSAPSAGSTPPPAPSASEPSQPGVDLPDVLASIDPQSGSIDTTAEGAPVELVDTENVSAGVSVADGRIVHGAPAGPDAASYLEVDIGKPVERIGADAVFSDKVGAIALVAWQSSLAEARDANAALPNAGIHFVARASGWHLGVFVGGEGEEIIAEGKLALRGGEPQRFDLIREGDTVTIIFPNGDHSEPISDPRIGKWSGGWVTWELYEHDVEAEPATFTGVWAG